MTSLIGRNTRMALQSIRTTKLRSVMTMFGIIIGVASVITAVSLGEGLRRQVAGTVSLGNKDTITVRPGKLVNRGPNGTIESVNYMAALGVDSLNEQDMQAIAKLPSVEAIVPLSTVSAQARNRDNQTFDGTVIGTTPEFSALSGQKVAYGSFFDSDDKDPSSGAVIGKTVAEDLFQENVPIGQTLTLRGHDFIIRGIFDEFKGTAFTNGTDLNRSIFIPYQLAKEISGNTASIYQFLVQPKGSVQSATREITQTLTDTHGGLQNFTVLTKPETIELAGKTLSLATTFIAGIAAISLIVGGIGIMNIMFVSVTERTREIGIRKSLGATNRQIYGQFLIEATIISLVGGIIGVILALLTNFCITVLSDLHPVATWPIIVIAVLTSTAVGIIFGTAPAIKAARKDPIESLRYE